MFLSPLAPAFDGHSPGPVSTAGSALNPQARSFQLSSAQAMNVGMQHGASTVGDSSLNAPPHTGFVWNPFARPFPGNSLFTTDLWDQSYTSCFDSSSIAPTPDLAAQATAASTAPQALTYENTSNVYSNAQTPNLPFDNGFVVNGPLHHFGTTFGTPDELSGM